VLAEALNQPAPVDLRVNTLRGERDEVRTRLAQESFALEPTPYSPAGLRRTDRAPLFSTSCFKEGLFEVQDEGSQLVATLVGAKAGHTVLDACAGSGGKTLALAAAMGNRGVLIALDTTARKLDDLKKRAARAGVSNYEAILVDPESHPLATAKDVRRGVTAPRPPRLPGAFDAILVDAPCSGLGDLRRTPEIRWRRGPEDLAHYPRVQSALLDRWAPLVKAGGALVYATCTLRRAENEDVVERFLSGHPDFSAGDARQALPQTAQRVVDGSGFLRTMPHRHGCDGFFAVRLRRA